MPKRTPTELDNEVTVQASAIKVLEEANEETEELVETIRRESETKIAVLQAEVAHAKKENAELKDSLRKLEEYIRTLLTTTIFGMATAFVAVVVAFIKK